MLLTLPTNAFLGTIFRDSFCLSPKLAVPYIPAFRLFVALLAISISIGKFKVSSAFEAINVILPVNVLSGKTLAVISTLFPSFKFATWLSFTATFNLSLETFTMSNNAVAGIPVKIEPGSMYFLLIKP